MNLISSRYKVYEEGLLSYLLILIYPFMGDFITVLKYQSTKYLKSFKLKVWTVHQEIEKPAISNF